MKTKTITLRVPVNVARFLYTVIAYFLNPDGEKFSVTLARKDKNALAEVFDELAIELSMVSP